MPDEKILATLLLAEPCSGFSHKAVRPGGGSSTRYRESIPAAPTNI